MKVSQVSIRNFRRLEDVQFNLEEDHTILVGPNNSGKTSVAAAFRLFFKRGEFSINDFTVACIAKLNDFGTGEDMSPDSVPRIEMDLWLSIDPEIEFGRVFTLVPNVTTEFDKVGIRLSYGVKDASLLKSEYEATFPKQEGGSSKSIAHFLALPNLLSRHFSIQYFALEVEEGVTKAIEIEPEEGRRVLHTLVRLDFIDAQRNIHDQDGGRHNRLSAAFAAFYKHNLEKPADNEAANKVIDENNTRLTDHYEQHFKPLLGTISKLGVPSAHDRTLRLVSSLSPEEALRGSTELYYVDAALKHELPEAYNGLGFKNLVYMAIQVSHYHAQWLATENNRELCQLIFIEEPEVHLHAQVQQIFISNIWKILKESAAESGEPNAVPQLALSTHSSHIVDTVAFEKVRYFRRCPMKGDAGSGSKALNATCVLSLKDFRPWVLLSEPLSETEVKELDEEQKKTLIAARTALAQADTLDFLKKYLKLTHCDLFFADAAVLVEGTVEKLLMSQMIDKCARGLQARYLTVLEVGGAYAHQFSSLIGFLGIPYVVITDIDTIDPADGRKACRADAPNAGTSNATLKSILGAKTRDELLAISAQGQVVADGSCFVAFQRPVVVKIGASEYSMHGRTLEEAFIYENVGLFSGGALDLGVNIGTLQTGEEILAVVYKEVREPHFKKTEFALRVASSPDNWVTPAYIESGLKWLESKLAPTPVHHPAAAPVAAGEET
jgi:predicted ATP-dependent endonuclease of OLD family